MRIFIENRMLCCLVLISILSCTNNSHGLTYENMDKNKKNKENSLLTEMQFIKPYIEVGEVLRGDTAEGKFYFVNTGKNQLIIDYINPDCNCTSFFVNKKKLNPGDTGFVALEVKTKNKIGKSRVSAVISANTKLKLYKITLEANVKNNAN